MSSILVEGQRPPQGPRSREDLPTVSRPYLLEVYPGQACPSIYTAQYDLLTGVHDGINSEGLAVALLADEQNIARFNHDMPMTLGVGMYAPMLLRSLLDTCAALGEANDALLKTKQYPFVLHSHFLISDGHGGSFIWEKSPLNGTEHIIYGVSDVQTLTNHLPSDPEPADISVDTDVGWTRTRLSRLTDAVNGITGKISTSNLKDAHEPSESRSGSPLNSPVDRYRRRAWSPYDLARHLRPEGLRDRDLLLLGRQR